MYNVIVIDNVIHSVDFTPACEIRVEWKHNWKPLLSPAEILVEIVSWMNTANIGIMCKHKKGNLCNQPEPWACMRKMGWLEILAGCSPSHQGGCSPSHGTPWCRSSSCQSPRLFPGCTARGSEPRSSEPKRTSAVSGGFAIYCAASIELKKINLQKQWNHLHNLAKRPRVWTNGQALIIKSLGYSHFLHIIQLFVWKHWWDIYPDMMRCQQPRCFGHHTREGEN